ncbi:hypothetical protein GN156_17950 [bacterium LRH843]|nr:hypothetical protein [bacterium LRH843]
MKKKLVMIAAGCVLMLAACGKTGEDQPGENIVDEMTPIEVELDVPETADVNEEVMLKTTVTHGDDIVTDANEVVYEIWLEGQKEQGEMIEAVSQEENVYLLPHSFEEAGLYNVQTHVTARSMHRMPTAQIRVGDVEEEVQVHEGDGEHAHHEHSVAVVDAKVEDNRIAIHVELDGTAYTGGEVTLEMWQEGDEKHQWVDVTEVGDGEFEVQNIEDFSGTYSVVVHITDEHVHEHVEVSLEF